MSSLFWSADVWSVDVVDVEGTGAGPCEGCGGGIKVTSRSRLTTPRLRHKKDSGSRASVFTAVFTAAFGGTTAMSVLPIGVAIKFDGTAPHEIIQRGVRN